MRLSRTDVAIAAALAASLFLVYNSNGREIGSYDSQPTKFAARELLLRGTLTLNHVVGAVPLYAERTAFVLSRDGQYRSGYSPVPALAAAALVYPAAATGAIDVRSPSAPGLIAVLAASTFTSIAVAALFLAARRLTSRWRALAIAVALGLGTGLWSLVSRTLWEHETAILGLAIAMLFFCGEGELQLGEAVGTGAGLALAGLARPQLAPVIAIILAGVAVRAARGAAVAAVAVVAVAGGLLMLTYWRWFGHPLGAIIVMQAEANAVHGTSGFLSGGFEGFAGLLFSPSRGLLVFSPVVAIALAGYRDAVRANWSSPLRWCAIAAAVQFVVYGGYAVWWAGHTYGPRYMLDVLPLLAPLAASALARMRFGPVTLAASAIALTWSIAIAATGAFCYPHDAWNTSPVEVNREHSRLWNWSDPQFVRCWRTGLSPQNFDLLRDYGWMAGHRD
jgi:hypothetical protein